MFHINNQKKTQFLSSENAHMQKQWLLVDAKDQTLGRLGSEIARLLKGKHKPQFSPHVDGGDYVVVINASKIKLTGLKWQQKTYYRHSGYVGGLKSVQAKDLHQKKPTEILYLAVKGMLPKQKLRAKLLKNLKIFPNNQHTCMAQQPKKAPLRLASSNDSSS
ncbi:MAG: 50S ribosomal protein L13 [Proteobacteria bacterium]|nr:50S ribosomal protein L13 [Pseudomonadota bacterium]